MGQAGQQDVFQPMWTVSRQSMNNHQASHLHNGSISLDGGGSTCHSIRERERSSKTMSGWLVDAFPEHVSVIYMVHISMRSPHLFKKEGTEVSQRKRLPMVMRKSTHGLSIHSPNPQKAYHADPMQRAPGPLSTGLSSRPTAGLWVITRLGRRPGLSGHVTLPLSSICCPSREMPPPSPNQGRFCR